MDCLRKVNYEISSDDAQYLIDLRCGKEVKQKNRHELKELLKKLLDVSKSVSENGKEWIQEMSIIHGDIHPYQAEKLNVPTLEGALLCAVKIPRVECNSMCGTCAFRVGSPANQSERVAEDIEYALENGENLMCHADEPTKHICRGFQEHKNHLT